MRNRFRMCINNQKSKWIILAALCVTMVAYGCGGGSGGSGGGSTNPTAMATVSPATVESGNAVTLDGSGSTDDGTISTYVWSQVSPATPAVDFTGDDTGTHGFSFAAPTVTASTDFTFRLTVTDNEGNTGTADVSLTVTPRPAGAPTAAAAISPATAVPGATITLDGSGSTDDGTISSYTWSQVSPASPTVDFSGDDVSDNGFTFAAPTVTTSTVFTFRLTVTDDEANTGTTDVTLTVAPPANASPTADAAVSASTVDEGTSVTLDASGSIDSDGTIATYVWAQTAPASPAVDFSADDTSDATFAFTAPGVGSQTVFTFEVTVTDDEGSTDTAQVTLTVDPTDQIGVFQELRDDLTNLTTAAGSGDWRYWGGPSGSIVAAEKSGGTDITTYTEIGANNGVARINKAHLHAFEWSDGTTYTTEADLPALTNDGIFFSYDETDGSQEGNGFSITVPADTSLRAFTVVVGVLDGEMKVAANLNNSGSPGTPILTSSEVLIDNPDHSNVSTVSPTKNGGLYRKVTFLYRAVSTADQLTVQCTLNDDNGTASVLYLDAAYLTAGTITAPIITPDGGHFTETVTVQSMSATPDDAEIRYTTDGSAPSASSPLFSSFTLSTDTTVKAQAFRDGYTSGPVTEAVFAFSSLAAGSLGISVQDAPVEAVDLSATAGATGDWVQYGKDDENDVNEKTGATLIGTVTKVGTLSGPTQIGNPIPYAFDWSDGSTSGTSEATGMNIRRGIFYDAASGETGEGFSLDVTADMTPRTLWLHISVQDADALVSAALASDATSPVTMTIVSPPATDEADSWFQFKLVKIEFTGASGSDTLTVTTTIANDYSTASAVSLQAAIVTTD